MVSASPELRNLIRAQLAARAISSVVEQGARQDWLHEMIRTPFTHQAFGLEAGLIHHDPADPLPLEAATQDLALSLGLFERIRMDQLYMVAAEARRVLRPGGLWLLSGLTFPQGWRRLLPAPRGRRALDLTHYVSPEDWRTLTEASFPEGRLTIQFLALERL